MKRKRYYSNPFKEYREKRGRPAQRRDFLTDEIVAALRPREREYSVHDMDCEGMTTRVRPAGSKTFTFRSKSLGKFPDISVEQARSLARERERRITEGRAAASFAAPVSRATLSKLYAAYLLDCRAGKDWRRKIELAFERRILPAIGDLPLTELSPSVMSMIVPPGVPFFTHHQLRYMISRLLSWAVETGRITHNPLKGWPPIRRPKPKWRHDPLGRLELSDIWEASEALRAPWCGIVQLVLLTGEPIERVLSLTRWEIEDGHEHYVRKCDFLPNAMKLLLSLDLNPGEYVFGTGNGSRPRVPPSAILRQLRDATHREFSWRGLSRAIQSLAKGLPGGLREWDKNHLEILAKGYGYEAIDADL